MARDVVRVGCGSAYAEDRIAPAVDLVERADIEYIALDCLAERTLVHAQLRRLEDPAKGYDLRLDELVRRVAAPAFGRGIRFIANMGAANPVAAAVRTAEILAGLGCRSAKVASVVGDDLLDVVLRTDPVTASGRRVSELGGRVVTANAYIGAEPIVEALAEGADVVVGGRLADPSLFLAPAIHELGWALDDWDLLGGGQTAGHLLECGTHGVGGNFADPPYRVVPDLWNLGLPCGDIRRDGTSTIWKLDGTGGLVDVENCKAQLVYEVHDPAAYLTPDVTVDVRDVTLAQAAPNRVDVRGARGTARPERLKVLVGAMQGFIGEGELSFAGPGALSRAELAAETVAKRLAHDGVVVEELRTDFVGRDSVHAAMTPASDREPWEVRLRMAARCETREAAQAVADEVEFMFFGPAAGGGARKAVRPLLAMYDVYVERGEVPLTVSFVEAAA